METIVEIKNIYIYSHYVFLGLRQDKGRPLPKFGEWDVNNPASAEGFTVIFNKARDERKTSANTHEKNSPSQEERAFKQGPNASKPHAVRICS